MDSGILTNLILSLLLKKIVVPSDFRGQCEAVRKMLKDDATGLVDTLTDFAVESAKVEFSIEANNDRLNNLFKKWLDTINLGLSATVPIGIKALAEEYFKERWKGSGFCVLKIAKWGKVDGSDFILPIRMFIVDGSSIKAHEADVADSNLKLDSYNYYIGNTTDNKYLIKSDSAIINRPYCRWFDKYPTPYLIKRGIYHNYKIIESLKTRQTEILDQIIPYLLLIKKGTEGLATSGTKVYSDTELQEVIRQMQELMNNMKSTSLGNNVKFPIRATNFDEEIKHLIPDVGTMFKTELFEQAERNILAGLGFIDVIQGISSTRRESVLNPKAFIQEINSGVEGFKEILSQLLVLIKLQNESHIKYNASDLYVCSSPVKAFMTDEFKDRIRSLYDRGGISKKTYTELVGEVDFETEVYRRKREAKEGIEYIMYPQITRNVEEKGIDTRGKDPDYDEDAIPEDKKGIEKLNYDYSSTDEITNYDLINSFDEEIELETSDLKTKVRITERYLRYRQIDPNKFEKDSFRTIVISPSKKIKAIVGKLKGKKTTTIQSYLFLKEKWSDKEAQDWLRKHSETFSAIINKFDLVTAPYQRLADLPFAVKKLSKEKQEAWRKIWNEAFRYMLAKTGNEKTAETYAFRTAWARIKLIKSNQGFLKKLRDKFIKK